MIGITGYSAYLPRWRLERGTAAAAMAWFAPGLGALSGGERSVCNHDEDALTMAAAAARSALHRTPGAAPSALYLCSTTLPYADRLSGAILKTALNLGQELYVADITGSQRAGTIGLLAALDRVRNTPGDSALVAASDQRLARPGSAEELLFGDGAAAVCVGHTGVLASIEASYTITRDTVDHYRRAGEPFDYVWEERWIAAETGALLQEVLAGLFARCGLSPAGVDTVVFPFAAKQAHARIGAKLGFSEAQLADNGFDTCGETGVAHPLQRLAAVLDNAAPGRRIIVIGLGSGADALLFETTEAVARERAPRSALSPLYLTQYTQFLAFRDLLVPAQGVRGERPQKTALSVLQREQESILGLVGGICDDCNTPQFPRGPVCVNPACRKPGALAPYRFAHRAAVVKTFTGDYLVPTVSPPSIYGMIAFEGGGRMMIELTDCTLDEIHVGARVRPVFRRRYTDPERGFVGYFWKAVPLGEEAS